ncbi:MAG: hypothetical protein IIT37_12345, partial [Bacteroidales bacterium]|nr:hypothetical protein [Bacteroidales bacterium]
MSLNSEFFTLMGQVADDEALMKKIVNYVKKLVKQKPDPTLMTKEEFFAKIERAEKQIEEGKYTTLLPGETVTDMLKRCG